MKINIFSGGGGGGEQARKGGKEGEERAGIGSSKKAGIICFKIVKILSKTRTRTFFDLH